MEADVRVACCMPHSAPCRGLVVISHIFGRIMASTMLIWSGCQCQVMHSMSGVEVAEVRVLLSGIDPRVAITYSDTRQHDV